MLIIDPGLRYTFGHHFDYDCSIADEMNVRGFGCKIYSSSSTQDELVRSRTITTLPLFLYEKPSFLQLHRIIGEYRQCLSTILDIEGKLADHVFFPNAGLVDLLTLASLDESYIADRRFSLILRFSRISDLFQEDINSDSIFLHYAKQLGIRKEFSFFADTLRLVNLWRGHDIPCDLVPLPVNPDLGWLGSDTPLAYHFSMLGQQCIGKGLEFLFGFNQHLISLNLLPKIFVQSVFLNISTDIKIQNHNIEFSELPMSKERFSEHLRQSMIISNFYDPKGYHYQSSSILLEVLISGRIPLLSDYPFAREIMPAALHSILQSYSVEGMLRGFFLAQRLASGNAPDLSQELFSLAHTLRAEHNPARLIDTICPTKH
jgi:hypothetical protein